MGTHSRDGRVKGGVGSKCYLNTLVKFSNNKKEIALVEENVYCPKRKGSLLQCRGCEWMQEQLLYELTCGSANATI